jgi:hypothetical protein
MTFGRSGSNDIHGHDEARKALGRGSHFYGDRVDRRFVRELAPPYLISCHFTTSLHVKRSPLDEPVVYRIKSPTTCCCPFLSFRSQG